MRKRKSLYSITIEGCSINTILNYNLNTNHIRITATYFYRDLDKKKQYYKNNREYYKDKAKQQYRNNRDPNATIKGSKEYSIMCSCRNREIPIEDFDEFISNQKYCYKFNNKCRELNRDKYNRKCFICGKDEIKNNERLSVHHIDMSKSQGCNGEQWKLVPLCKSCHSKCHNELWKSRIEYLLKYHE